MSWALNESPTLKSLSQLSCGAAWGAVCLAQPHLWGLEEQLWGKQAQRGAPHYRGGRPPPPALQLSAPSDWACGHPLSPGQGKRRCGWVADRGPKGAGGRELEVKAQKQHLSGQARQPGPADRACSHRPGRGAWFGGVGGEASTSPERPRSTLGSSAQGGGREARTQGPPWGVRTTHVLGQLTVT